MTQQLILVSAVLAGTILALAGVSRFFWHIGRWRRSRARESKKNKAVRFPFARALVIADQVLARLALHDAVLRCSCAGSVRRMQETVGDIDLVVASDRPEEVIDAFLSLTQGTGRKKRFKGRKEWQRGAITVTPEGLRLELYVVPLKVYGPALFIMTGSWAHTDAISKRALQCIYGVYFGLVRFWSLSAPGRPNALEAIEILMHLLRTSNANEIGESEQEISEEEIYERLGMQWIPPTLR